MKTWVTWIAIEDGEKLMGPCGCVVDNNYEGIVAARDHIHDEPPEQDLI